MQLPGRAEEAPISKKIQTKNPFLKGKGPGIFYFIVCGFATWLNTCFMTNEYTAITPIIKTDTICNTVLG